MQQEEWTWKSASGTRRTRPRSKSEGDEYIWQQATVGRMLSARRGVPSARGERKAVTQQMVRESTYRCGFCRGEGKVAGATCPVCKGKGVVSITNPPAIGCAFCRGTGRAKPRSSVTCLACKGKGIIPVVEPVEFCHKCGGLGKEPNNKTLPCEGCKGAGVVSVEKRGGRWIRSPSGSERDAAKAIYRLGGVAGATQVGREIGVSSAYSDYILKSMLQRGYLEKVGRGLYALTPECEKVIAEQVERDEAKGRIEEEKMKATEEEQVARKELTAPWELWEGKEPPKSVRR